MAAAKEKAASSFQELMQLRSALEVEESNEDVKPTVASQDFTRNSLKETDELLEEFRRSLASFHELPLLMTTSSATDPHRSSNLTMTAGPSTLTMRKLSSSGGADEDLMLTAFLEKYSDKLVEIVGEKILAKVSKP